VNREPIYAALFAKLSSSYTFVTASRRLKHWSDVPPADQPALFLTQERETAATTPGLNTVWQGRASVYLYANTGENIEIAPSTILNPMVDAIEATLKPDPISNKQTLGGLVQHVWIEGDIQTDEGVLGPQGVVIIPLVFKFA
jgi:hypothetical protein